MDGSGEEIGRLVAAILAHPAVDAVRISQVGDADAAITYLDVTVAAAWRSARRTGMDTGISDRAARRAAVMFDLTYARGNEAGDRFAGWNSSFTQAPFPPEEMEAWVEATLDRIRPLAGCAVVEIGCGTGLLARPLASIATSYLAVDPSARAIQALARWAAEEQPGADFSAEVGDARHLRKLAAGSAGLIVINSVAQYFPSTDYLMEVLAECARVLAPQGRLFLGDLRNLDLLDDFHLRRITALAGARTMAAAEARHAAARSRMQDGELCIAPAFFDHLPGFTADLAGKAGEHANEMTLYRYDATLTRGPARPRPAALDTITPQGAPLAELHAGRAELERLRAADVASTGWADAPAPRHTRDSLDSELERTLLRELEALAAPSPQLRIALDFSR